MGWCHHDGCDRCNSASETASENRKICSVFFDRRFPVIAYNASSIPEIIGDTPLLMNSLDKEELCSKLELLSDESLCSEVIQKGLENVKRFSWDKMYEQLMSLYEEAYNGN